jgi:RNA polymerase sigma-70 factor, ECF subfamily
VGDEGRLLVLLRAGDFKAVATQALETYGPELYGFLVNTLRSESAGSEVFLQVGEDLWRGLPRFAARASVRTWLYVLARNAATDYQRSPWNARERRASLGVLDDVLARTRSRTAPWLRTEIKEQVRVLRESLSPEDRDILVLRVDRGLPWEDVARVMLGDENADGTVLTREVARLTKRYQLIKEQLRKRAKEIGLLGEDGQ